MFVTHSDAGSVAHVTNAASVGMGYESQTGQTYGQSLLNFRDLFADSSGKNSQSWY